MRQALSRTSDGGQMLSGADFQPEDIVKLTYLRNYILITDTLRSSTDMADARYAASPLSNHRCVRCHYGTVRRRLNSNLTTSHQVQSQIPDCLLYDSYSMLGQFVSYALLAKTHLGSGNPFQRGRTSRGVLTRSSVFKYVTSCRNFLILYHPSLPFFD